jgi:SOS-response transcriptional repressor LexA
MSGLGKRIREAREAKGLSQAKVGAACNPPITGQAVYKWEHNLSTPSAEDLDILAQLTGKTVRWFLYGTGQTDYPDLSVDATHAGRAVASIEFVNIMRHIGGDSTAASGSVRTNYPCSDRAFQTFIEDDANDPELRAGDSVIIDLSRSPKPGKLCLAIFEGRPVIRRYRPRKEHVELVPINDHWPTVEVDASAILGAVTEITRPH